MPRPQSTGPKVDLVDALVTADRGLGCDDVVVRLALKHPQSIVGLASLIFLRECWRSVSHHAVFFIATETQ